MQIGINRLNFKYYNYGKTVKAVLYQPGQFNSVTGIGKEHLKFTKVINQQERFKNLTKFADIKEWNISVNAVLLYRATSRDALSGATVFNTTNKPGAQYNANVFNCTFVIQIGATYYFKLTKQ